MSSLREIGRDQGPALQALLSSGESELLIRLAQSECLLGVARLSALRTDLVSYTGMVVGVITQFVPCRACRLSLEAAEVPPIEVTYGEVPDEGGTVERHELSIDDTVVGEVLLAAEVPAVSPPSFVRSLAEQISSSLDALIEAERLRRQAAVAKTMHLVEALSEQADPDDLGQLVEALASLPNALGARLEIVHPAVGGAVQLEAGSAPTDIGPPIAVAGGTIAAAVRWSAAAQQADRSGFADVLSMLAKALDKAEERRVLRDEAEIDPVTGIGNRRRAIRTLASAISFAERSSQSVGVLFVDLDHFKRVNDTLGHEVGDQVLSCFAQHLTRVVRAYDTVARFGGEEFLVVCPGLDETSGVSLSRRMLDSTPAACAAVLPEGWVQTASAGLACYPETSDYVEGILRAADRALYAAKRAGRNQMRVASHLDE